jgi:mitochondrial pyruvate carrier 1
LFACHATNATAQLVQEARFANYWYNGGREARLNGTIDSAKDTVKTGAQEAVNLSKEETAKVARAK